jgi:hypothetical protein
VALLDVTVMKLFPVGFVETDTTGRSSRPFDQSTEDEAQRAWEVSSPLLLLLPTQGNKITDYDWASWCRSVGRMRQASGVYSLRNG